MVSYGPPSSVFRHPVRILPLSQTDLSCFPLEAKGNAFATYAGTDVEDSPA